MIVKNEEHVIERCLEAISPRIDAWCIADTGSTDKTIEKIQKMMKDKQGMLLQHEWKDFGTNRTKVFEYIRENKLADYAIVIDADDIIEGTEINIDDNTDIGMMTIKHGEMEFSQARIFNMKLEWKYIGKIHAYPMTTSKTEDEISTNSIIGTVINHIADGSSNANIKKYKEKADIIKTDDLSIPRNQFYYAQLLKDAEEYDEAIIEYQKRIEMMNGWEQERVYSKLMIARIEHHQGKLELATMDYMATYEMDPERHEALKELVNIFKMNKKYNLALVFIDAMKKQLEKSQTSEKLFAEKI